MHRHRQVGVFDDDELAVLRAEMTKLFLGVGLGHHLARHLGSAEEVPADERRIDRPHEWVIDLKIAERVDPFTLHEIERTAAVERAERAAVPVGRERERTLGFEQDLAVKTDGRHATLAEEMHAGDVESEEIVLLKKGLGRRVVLVAGHDEPVERPTVAPARHEQFLGKHLKERFARDGRDRKRAFRPIVTETGPLTARHRERRHATGAQRRFTRDLGLLPRRGITAVGHQRLVGGGG
jgi:hypothetical protein